MYEFNILNHIPTVCVCVSAQSCLTLCDPMDCNPPDSSVCGIFQARILEWKKKKEEEWVAISYSKYNEIRTTQMTCTVLANIF